MTGLTSTKPCPQHGGDNRARPSGEPLFKPTGATQLAGSLFRPVSRRSRFTNWQTKMERSPASCNIFAASHRQAGDETWRDVLGIYHPKLFSTSAFRLSDYVLVIVMYWHPRHYLINTMTWFAPLAITIWPV